MRDGYSIDGGVSFDRAGKGGGGWFAPRRWVASDALGWKRRTASRSCALTLRRAFGMRQISGGERRA
jgi:hypothetical protein